MRKDEASGTCLIQSRAGLNCFTPLSKRNGQRYTRNRKRVDWQVRIAEIGVCLTTWLRSVFDTNSTMGNSSKSWHSATNRTSNNSSKNPQFRSFLGDILEFETLSKSYSVTNWDDSFGRYTVNEVIKKFGIAHLVPVSCPVCGNTQEKIAEMFGVEQKTISNIITSSKNAQMDDFSKTFKPKHRQIVELYLRAWNTQEKIAEMFDIARTSVTQIINQVKKDHLGDFDKTFC